MTIQEAIKKCKKYDGIAKRKSIKTVHYKVIKNKLIGFYKDKHVFSIYPSISDILAIDWEYIDNELIESEIEK